MKYLLLITTALAAAPLPVFAAEAEEIDAPTIIVTGYSEGYVATNSVTATKTDTPLIDVPQTISVVTRQQLDDQAQHSMADVLRYVPGTTVGQGEGNRDQITIRGQNSTADFFVDGVQIKNRSFAFVQLQSGGRCRHKLFGKLGQPFKLFL